MFSPAAHPPEQQRQAALSGLFKLGAKRVERSKVTLHDHTGTGEAVVVPASPVPHLKALVSAFDPMTGIGLAVVGFASLIDLDMLQ